MYDEFRARRLRHTQAPCQIHGDASANGWFLARGNGDETPAKMMGSHIVMDILVYVWL